MSNLNLEKMQKKGQKFLSELADIIEDYDSAMTSFQNAYPPYKKCKIMQRVSQAEATTYIPKVANDAYFDGDSWGKQSLANVDGGVETKTAYEDEIKDTEASRLLQNTPFASQALDEYFASNSSSALKKIPPCTQPLWMLTGNLADATTSLTQLQSTLFQLMEYIEFEQEVVNDTITSTNVIIQNLEAAILPIKKKLQALYGGDLTSVGMLTEANYLYNQQLTGTCLIGVLTAAAGVGIFLNWKSMRTN